MCMVLILSGLVFLSAEDHLKSQRGQSGLRNGASRSHGHTCSALPSLTPYTLSPCLSYLVFSSWNLVPHHGMSTYHLSSEARFKYSPFHEIFASQKIFDFCPLHIHNTLCLASLTTFTSVPYNTGTLSLSQPLPLGITPQMYGPLRHSISVECAMLMED